MSNLSRSSIVSAGLLRAGNTSLTTNANGWLNNRLRTWAASWTWMQLIKRLSGIVLDTGVKSISFGAGANGEAQWVKEIFNPIKIYTSDFSRRGNLFITQLITGDIWNDESVNNPLTSTGMPSGVKIRANQATQGMWDLIPWPVPDIAHLLAIDYAVIPNDIDISANGDASIPWYPNDETLIAAVETDALYWMNRRQAAIQQEQRMEALYVGDKVRYGSVTGMNDKVALDPQIYRSGYGGPYFPWPT